jgi:hypothetical protein
MKGFVYKIVNDVNDNIYIGSTTQTLAQRMGGHRRMSKQVKYKTSKIYQAFDEIGVDHFNIILIEEVDVPDKQHLKMVEDNCITQFDSKLNGYNGIQSYRTEEQKIKGNNKRANEYYYANKVLCQAKKKQYYNINKNKIKERQKIYEHENIEHFKKYRKEYQENNKELIRIKKKEYREKNKEKLKEKAMLTYVCEVCNKELTIQKKKRHEQTKRHNDNMSKKE